MTPETSEHEQCGRVGEILSRLGDKWTGRVVKRLEGGAMRFGAIRRSIDGISQRMLTLTLRGLERDGLVERTVFPTVPPAVEYRLTELGRSLAGRLDVIGDWALANQPRIEAARARYDGGDAAAPPIGAGTPAARR